MIPLRKWIFPKKGVIKPRRGVASVSEEFQTLSDCWSSKNEKSCWNSICQQPKVNCPMREQNQSFRTNGTAHQCMPNSNGLKIETFSYKLAQWCQVKRISLPVISWTFQMCELQSNLSQWLITEIVYTCHLWTAKVWIAISLSTEVAHWLIRERVYTCHLIIIFPKCNHQH